MTTFTEKPDYLLSSNALGYLRQPLNVKPTESDADGSDWFTLFIWQQQVVQVVVWGIRPFAKHR
jgi:hypothetical protein